MWDSLFRILYLTQNHILLNSREENEVGGGTNGSLLGKEENRVDDKISVFPLNEEAR